ncbi:Iota toxin protein Ib [Brevibacterium sp. JNUCC-42]|nr:Iota toxin protein Ib [Brevibacterium sp. JNUCC-42]
MKLKSIFTCLTITAVLSQIAVYPIASYAETGKGEGVKVITEDSRAEQGLVGYYFKDPQFTDLSFIEFGGKSELIDKMNGNEDIQSVRWMGRLKPSQTGEYLFSTSSDQNVILQLDGETIINQAEMTQKRKLEKDKMYEIKIEYRDTQGALSDLQLFWSMDDRHKELVPEQHLLTPNFSEIANSKASMNCGDDIPREWQINGYTFKNQQIVAWDDSYAALGYKKYVSNPNKCSTVADPYTDLEKVAGLMPAATKYEARDPLVAAYPAVGVGLEKLLFSKNENVTEGSSGTKSKSVTNTSTTVDTVEVSGKIGWGEKGFSFEISPKYAHSWSNSTAVQNTESQSWSSQIGMNTADAAYLNANVRYYNAGTAPIYELRPTTNFVFQNSGSSIATITAGPNQIGNSLGGGKTYPAIGQAPISLDKANESGTARISINKDQLDAIQTGKEILNIETTQNKGQYGTLNERGQLVTDASKQWEPIRTNIDAVSGALTLNLGASTESLERRVAARNPNDPEDLTPEITIKEAIQRAFNAKEKEGRLYYTDENRMEIILDEAAVNLIGDKNTQKDIEDQLSQMQDKRVYNAKWKRGMNITLHIPTVYYDFETIEEDWGNITRLDGGFTGKKHAQIGPNGNGYAKKDLELQPYTTYTARAYVKTSSPTGKNNVTFYVDDTVAGNGRGERCHVTIEGDEWQIIEFAFKTGKNPESFKKLGLANAGNTNLHFDDVSVSAWGQWPDPDPKPDGNLIKNGDFSEGNNFWNLDIVPVPGKIENGYFIGYGIMSDSFNVKPNTKYKLAFDLRSHPGASARPTVFLSKLMEQLEISNDWTRYSFDYTTASNETSVHFSMMDMFGRIFNLDNVELREVK